MRAKPKYKVGKLLINNNLDEVNFEWEYPGALDNPSKPLRRTHDSPYLPILES
jgi:hypothetical protein